MKEHMEGRGTIRFMGQHELVLDADFDWDEAGRAAVSGVGKLKMLKWLIYPFTADTHAERLPNGAIHCEGGLKSQFGNGALKAVIDLDADGAFTGYVGLTKGLRLAIEGKRMV